MHRVRAAEEEVALEELGDRPHRVVADQDRRHEEHVAPHEQREDEAGDALRRGRGAPASGSCAPVPARPTPAMRWLLDSIGRFLALAAIVGGTSIAAAAVRSRERRSRRSRSRRRQTGSLCHARKRLLTCIKGSRGNAGSMPRRAADRRSSAGRGDPPQRADNGGDRCSRFAFTAAAARAWCPAPRCCRSRRFSKAATRRRFPSFGSERMGAPVMAFCRIDDTRDPPARAGDAARRADHPGPDAAAPGRPVQRPAPRRLHPDQLDAQLRRARASADFARGFQRDAAVHAAGDRDRAEARRPRRCRTRALLGGFAALTGAITLDIGRRRHPREVPGRDRREATSPRRPRRYDAREHGDGERPMLKQIEGSHAVAEAIALCRPRGDLRLSDHAADAHRRGPGRDGEGRRARRLRVHQRRVGVRRAVGGDRRLGRRRAHLHGDRQPGPAVHGRGGLQRRRASACRS